MRTKRKLDKEIKIPDNVDFNIDGFVIKLKGPKGSAQKNLHHPKVSMTLKDKTILIKTKEKKPSQQDRMLIGTFRAHILNLIQGVTSGYEYKIRVCSGHFPMSVGVEGKYVLIKNFLGEKVPRKARIMDGAEVKVEGDIIKITGVDKEIVGQTAARIEQATRITNRDRRVFQDGCYIIKKADKDI